MKKTARNIFLLVVVVLLLASVAGCKQETPVASGSLQVNTIKIMPYAYMGEAFDLRDVLLMEEGVEYSATACYVDLDTMTEYALEVNDLCFTPVAIRETVVVITAKRGSESAAKVIYIPTSIRAEPLDDLYKSSGTLGSSDPGISKEVNIDPAFLYGDESTTSLHVSFSSTDPHPYGNTFLNFGREEAQQYFSDQVWENAIVTFWVYNPSELPIEFQFRIVDDQGGVNLDWQTADGPHKQRAEPGQWTQLFFSLRKLGVTRRLTNGKFVTDQLSLKFRYDGYSTTESYSFDFYVDNIDVVDASVYPEVDTKYVLSDETIEQGWENMKMDTGWQGVYTEYDYEFIKGDGSTCSLKAFFNSEKSLTNSFICLSPEAEFDENPDMTGGILSGYFKFEGLDPKVSVDIVNKSWETSNRVDMNLQALGDGWYYGTLDLEDIQVGTGRNDQIIRIRLHFSGATNESIVYVDSLIYEYKYVEKVLEYADVDLINMSLDTGSYYNNLTYSYVTSPIIGSNTVRSLKLVAPANAAGRFTWNTNSAADKGEITSLPNMSYGTLGAWFYFGKQLPNATFQVTSDNWKGSTAIPFVFTKNNGDGWYYGELHGSDIKFVESANAKAVIRWTLTVPAGYTVYVDNLSWTTKYENSLSAAEIDPSVLYDGGDLLAGTDKISYDKRHWENVDNTDDFNKDGVVDPDLTTGLTCGVDTENVYGDYSVRSWYFKAAASSNYANAIAQLQLAKGYDMTGKNLAFDIKIDTDSKLQQTIGLRLQSTGWSNINEQNVTVKLNPGDWRTVVVDFSDVLKENADIANLGFISLYFDFATNAGKDRAIYIDNVRLTTEAATPDDEPLPLGPEDLFDGGDLLAGTDVLEYNRNHWENISNTHDMDKDGEPDKHSTAGLTVGVDKTHLNGQYSVRSWYFKAVANASFNNATAQFKLAAIKDVSNKKLSFDVYYDADTKVQQSIRVRLHSDSTGDMFADQTVKINPGAWKTVVLDFTGTLLKDSVATDLAYISFYFDFETNSGKERTVYIDNVQLVDMSVPTVGSDEPLPLGPEDQYDGGDLLANASAADKIGIFADDKFSYDSDSTNVCSNGEVGAYSVKSWKFTAAAGESGFPTALIQLPESVDMSGKVLALNAYIENANGSLSIYTIHNSGWSRLNESETSANYPNSTITGQWVTLYYDLGSKLAEGKDLTDVKFIKFQFSFKEGLDVEQNVYIDNVRLIDPSEVPPADDVSIDWTNMHQDKGAAAYYNVVTNEFSGAYVKGENSIKSLHIVAPAESEGRFTLNTDHAVTLGQIEALPDLYAGTLGAWFYFGESEPSAKIKVTEQNWKGSVELNFTFGEGQDGWYYGIVEGSQIVYTESSTPGLPIRLTFILPAGFDGYIDSMTMIPAETMENDWIKMRQDNGPTECNVETAFDRTYLKAENSVQSLYVQAPATENGKLTFHTEAAFGRDFDMSSGELGAWFYFGAQTPEAYLKLNGNGKASNVVAFEFAESENGWSYGVVDMYDVAYAETEGSSANTLRLTILIPAGYSIYMDGLSYDADAATEGSEKDTDLLGAATADAADWTEVNGLTVAQDCQDKSGDLSVRSWSFKASAAANTVADAKFDLGSNVDMTGKYLTFDAKSVVTQNLTLQLLDVNGEAITETAAVSIDTADWSGYVVDLNGMIVAGKDASAVRYISFSFDFVANTGTERMINIDNVDLIDAETVDSDWIHMDQYAAPGFQMAEASLSKDFVKAESSTVSLKIVAPAETEGHYAININNALKHRGTIGAWFYFGEKTPAASLSTADSSGEKCTVSVAFAFGEGQDGWYYGTAKLSDVTYDESVDLSLVSYVLISVPAEYTVYIDGLTYTDITETATDDMINLSSVKGAGIGSYAFSTDVVKDDSSIRSLSASVPVSIDFTPETALDLRDGTFSCWLYFGESGPSNALVRFALYSGSSNTGYANMAIESTGENGWYRATLDTSKIAANKQAPLASVDKIRIQFANQATYMDYLLFTANGTDAE